MRLTALLVVALAGCMPRYPTPQQTTARHPHRRTLAGPMQPERAPVDVPPARTVQLTADDVLGEKVRLGADQPRLAVVFLLARECRDESADLARGVDEQLLSSPIDQIGIVDMRAYSGTLRSLATWQLKRSALEGRTRRKQRREQHHVDASPGEVDRWHLVGDFDGALFKRFGIDPHLPHPLAFVVERDGVLRGPYRDVASVVGEVQRAFGSAASRRTASR